MRKALVVLGILVGSFLVPMSPVMAMTGNGTASNPFIISDVTDLQNMGNNLTAYYELGGNIDASATTTWNAGAGFDPVGDDWVTPFTGNFDGEGFVVNQLTINRPATGYIGLFGYTDGATIRNVSLTNVDITGLDETGGLVGDMTDTSVSDCSITGQVTGSYGTGGFAGFISNSTVEDCSSTADVVGTINTAYIGGFAGWVGLGTSIVRCYASGDVNNQGDVTGGFVGKAAECTISQCYATGDVDSSNVAGGTNGGFVGVAASASGVACTITDCYARGSVHSVIGDSAGFCSWNRAGWNNSLGIIDNCYSTGYVNVDSGAVYEAGFCLTNDGTITSSFWDIETSGQAASNGGTGLTTVEMKTKTTYVNAGWDLTNIWKMGGPQPGGWAAFWLSSIAFLLFAGIMFGATKNPGLSILMAFPLVAVAAWLGIGTTILQVVLIVVLAAAVIFAIYFILGRFA